MSLFGEAKRRRYIDVFPNKNFMTSYINYSCAMIIHVMILSKVLMHKLRGRKKFF